MFRYDAFDHIGYDANGEKLMRRKAGDRIDMTIGNTSSNLCITAL
jgi:BOP1NT (NUC169) domain